MRIEEPHIRSVITRTPAGNLATASIFRSGDVDAILTVCLGRVHGAISEAQEGVLPPLDRAERRHVLVKVGDAERGGDVQPGLADAELAGTGEERRGGDRQAQRL